MFQKRESQIKISKKAIKKKLIKVFVGLFIADTNRNIIIITLKLN